MCVLLMLAVNVLTLLAASPVPVTRDTLEMVSHVGVSDIGSVGRGGQMPPVIYIWRDIHAIYGL